jgi:hypothetical protein
LKTVESIWAKVQYDYSRLHGAANMHSKWRDSIDALGRKGDAEFLTALISGRFLREVEADRAGALVLNIDAPWGTGKTFLLDHWAGDLQDSGWTVLRFNAWANDFASDPLLNFTAAIDAQVAEKASLNKHIKTAAKKFSGSLVKNLAPVVAKSVFKAGANIVLPGASALIESMGADADKLVDQASDAVEKAAAKLIAQEKAITKHLSDFRESLQAFALSVRGDVRSPKPLVLLIDELDRCRPDFAIDLLEVLKHVFSVPGVYTVVATDTVQLSKSTKHAYGAEFESTEYLKRFFDLQYQLAVPDRQPLAYYLLDQQGLLSDPLFISPAESLHHQREYPNSPEVYRPAGASHGSDVPAKQRSGRAMILAAIADRLDLSNRDMYKLVELARSVADSFASSTSKIQPSPKLHLPYLLLLAGAFVKRRQSMGTDAAAKHVYEKSNRNATARQLPSGFRDSRWVETLFELYQASPHDLQRTDFRDNWLGREIAGWIATEVHSQRHLSQYRDLVLRCGQLVD